MATLANTRCDQADHSLVPGILVHADAGRQITLVHRINKCEGLVAHIRLDLPAITVDAVEDSGMLHGRSLVVRQQAFDTNRDVLEPSGRIDPRAHYETEIGAHRTRETATGLSQQRIDPGYRLASADPPQTLAYTADRYSNQFNLTYHFLQGRLTPYVQVGAGWAKLDSNIPDRPPATGWT